MIYDICNACNMMTMLYIVIPIQTEKTRLAKNGIRKHYGYICNDRDNVRAIYIMQHYEFLFSLSSSSPKLQRQPHPDGHT
jgi:hypothetical protein